MFKKCLPLRAFFGLFFDENDLRNLYVLAYNCIFFEDVIIGR